VIGFAELVRRYRTAVEEGSEHRLPPLNPPASEADLVAAEEALGQTLPEEVRELWSVSNGGESLLHEDFYPVSQFVEHTEETKLHWANALAEFIEPGKDGAVPPGEFVAVAHIDAGMVTVDLGGPGPHPVRGIDLTFMSGPAWEPLAPSLEAFARFWVDMAEAGYMKLLGPPHLAFGYTVVRRECIEDAQPIARRYDIVHLV
jgi:cell wall assembly regulator SMI1